jgi:hypothetical protein
MRIKQVYGAQGNGDHILATAKNEEATATIPRGTPVVLAFNGTDDGFAVVLPSTAGQAKANSLAFGVCATQIATGLPVGSPDDFFAYGLCPFAILNYATRAATTNSWTSSASIASGFVLAIDTVNNCFVTLSASTGSNGYLPNAVMVDSVSSFAASASATTDSRTVLTIGVRVFVRML